MLCGGHWTYLKYGGYWIKMLVNLMVFKADSKTYTVTLLLLSNAPLAIVAKFKFLVHWVADNLDNVRGRFDKLLGYKRSFLKLSRKQKF